MGRGANWVAPNTGVDATAQARRGNESTRNGLRGPTPTRALNEPAGSHLTHPELLSESCVLHAQYLSDPWANRLGMELDSLTDPCRFASGEPA